MGCPLGKRKREREESCAPLLEGPMLDFGSWLGLRASAHGLYGLLLPIVHACKLACHSIQWGEFVWYAHGHGPMLIMYLSSFAS